jgi:hypothetical protein
MRRRRMNSNRQTRAENRAVYAVLIILGLVIGLALYWYFVQGA